MSLFGLAIGSLVVGTYLLVWVVVRLRTAARGPNAKDCFWLIPFVGMGPIFLGTSILCWLDLHSTENPVFPEYHEGLAALSLLFYVAFFGLGFFIWCAGFIAVLLWWFGPHPRRDPDGEFEQRFGSLILPNSGYPENDRTADRDRHLP